MPKICRYSNTVDRKASHSVRILAWDANWIPEQGNVWLKVDKHEKVFISKITEFFSCFINGFFPLTNIATILYAYPITKLNLSPRILRKIVNFGGAYLVYKYCHLAHNQCSVSVILRVLIVSTSLHGVISWGKWNCYLPSVICSRMPVKWSGLWTPGLYRLVWV